MYICLWKSSLAQKDNVFYKNFYNFPPYLLAVCQESWFSEDGLAVCLCNNTWAVPLRSFLLFIPIGEIPATEVHFESRFFE